MQRKGRHVDMWALGSTCYGKSEPSASHSTCEALADRSVCVDPPKPYYAQAQGAFPPQRPLLALVRRGIPQKGSSQAQPWEFGKKNPSFLSVYTCTVQARALESASIHGILRPRRL